PHPQPQGHRLRPVHPGVHFRPGEDGPAARPQAFPIRAAERRGSRGGTVRVADYVLKYADGRGQIHQHVAAAGSEKELRDRYSQQGFLIYSIKPRSASAALSGGLLRGRKKLEMEKFLIFNQQFVTLIRAGLPILKGLDLLAERLTDPKLGPFIKAVRD